MKKRTLLMLLVLVVVSGFAVAQTSDSATLFLSGVVGDFVDIAVNPAPAATNLALNVAQSAPLQVATVVETSNTSYEVTATSANTFNFSDGTTNLPYTLYYDGSAVASSGDVVSSGASANNVSRTVEVTYPAAPGGTTSGTYSDTVTFQISTN